MAQLYKITDEEFDQWICSDPSEDDLREALLVLEAKRHSLWTVGTIDSYARDRYDRDSTYVARLVKIKAALAKLWVREGQISI